MGEWRAFVSATGGGASGACRNWRGDDDLSWRDPGFPQTDRHPVTCVSWDDAQEYMSWLSRRTARRIGCRARPSGSVRRPVLSPGVTGWGEDRGRMARAPWARTARTRRVCRTWWGTCLSGRRTAGRGTAAVVWFAAAPGTTVPGASGLARASGPPPPTGTTARAFAFRGRWIKSLVLTYLHLGWQGCPRLTGAAQPAKVRARQRGARAPCRVWATVFGPRG